MNLIMVKFDFCVEPTSHSYQINGKLESKLMNLLIIGQCNLQGHASVYHFDF